MISSNVLGKVMITDPGERFSIAFHAGAGARVPARESSLRGRPRRSMAFLLPQFDAIRALDIRAFLRYTY